MTVRRPILLAAHGAAAVVAVHEEVVGRASLRTEAAILERPLARFALERRLRVGGAHGLAVVVAEVGRLRSALVARDLAALLLAAVAPAAGHLLPDAATTNERACGLVADLLAVALALRAGLGLATNAADGEGESDHER